MEICEPSVVSKEIALKLLLIELLVKYRINKNKMKELLPESG